MQSHGRPSVVRTGSSTRVSSEWEKLLCELPGYDPYRGAAAFRFDAECAQRWIDFFQHPKDGCLRHIEGAVAGERFTLERWQQAFIANLFGWKRSDGTRRYREAFLFVPRKNGKTPMAAGICIGVLAIKGWLNRSRL
jgi:phage terminase large subunit-like protein